MEEQNQQTFLNYLVTTQTDKAQRWLDENKDFVYEVQAELNDDQAALIECKVDKTKYYIADISEIDATTVCDTKDYWIVTWSNCDWIDCEGWSHWDPIGIVGLQWMLHANVVVRIPYLTKEQIETEGWPYKESYKDVLKFESDDIWNPKTKGGFLYYDTKDHTLRIQIKDGNQNMDGPTYHTVFNGRCPSINDFRKIMKLLGLEGLQSETEVVSL